MMHTESLNLKVAVTPEEREQAIALLLEHRLPVSDLDEDKVLYLLMDNEQIAGTGGLEIFGDCALLRSVAVKTALQGRGHGAFISRELEHFAAESGIRCLYLLTTTAASFFAHQGFCEIRREDTPEAIRQSAEFNQLCPSSAVVMKKKI